MASAWGNSWGKSWGASFGGLIAVVLPQQQQGAGGGRAHYVERTSRNSDSDAYAPDRIAQRLQSIVIDGREYDPFADGLMDVLEQAAKTPEPDDLPEIDRHERKLARTFAVKTADRVVQVPMFRPMLREMPDFKQAIIQDFEAFAQKAKEESAEEMRRIMLLLLAVE